MRRLGAPPERVAPAGRSVRLWPRLLTWSALCGFVLATAAAADWLQPDPTYRDAQFLLRAAIRDTVGNPDNPARLDTLAMALLRLGRFSEAEPLFRRVIELSPGDDGAEAGLGKMALFADRLAEAESLLQNAMTNEPGAVGDLYAARLRRGDYARAAELAERAQETGRAELLRLMAERGAYRLADGPAEARVPWSRSYPVPLVRVKLNGQSVLMAIDTGARDVILDASAARRCRVEMLTAQSPIFWSGTRLAVRNAMVQRLEIGSMRVESIPAGVMSLRKWSIHIHPQSEPVVGVLGLNFLRVFLPTLDYESGSMVLRRPGAPAAPAAGAQRVPFEIWGDGELMVYGSLAGGRRMAMVVQSGVPECGVGAPVEVFEELGIKPGLVARAVKGAGTWLQGRPWMAVTVPTVSLGPVVQDKVRGWAGAMDSAELWRHGVRRDALLSHDFFKGQRVTFDWAAHQLIVEQPD